MDRIGSEVQSREHQSPCSVDQRKSIEQASALSNEEIELVLQSLARESVNILGAGRGQQTWSRFLVENYFSKWKWYNPNVNKPDAPSLSKGWIFFEHFTLPRHFSDSHSRKLGSHVLAPAGEVSTTELYSCLMTPQSSLSDWGIGVGMYFSTLITMSIIFILLGMMNIANMLYYSSNEYDPGEGRKDYFQVGMLKLSAICTDREWVVCNDCNDHIVFWNSIFASSYYGTAIDPTSGENVTLINRTTCLPAEFDQGMWNFGTLLLLILCVSIYMWYLSKLEIRYDEDNTVASDYTIIVKNPPPTAFDPEEWREFFEQYSDKQVTLCTIALDNESLVSKLVDRRIELRALKNLLPAGTNLGDESSIELAIENEVKLRKSKEGFIAKLLGFTITPILNLFGFALSEDMIWRRIKSKTEEIKQLQEREYKVAAVFVTFETEQGQRTALEALNTSRIEVLTNNTSKLNPSSLFRDTVLKVSEASEPTAVRWMDLNHKSFKKNLRMMTTLLMTLGLVALSAWVLNTCRTQVGTILFSVILSTFNIIVPLIIRILVSYERHYDEGSTQTSLYINITLFRWMNTAIVTRIITPFVATLGVAKIDMISTVNALVISEMIVSPILRYFDVAEILNRHYFAPRAMTQEELYGYFIGGSYNLAERFTDFTKILLLAIFYSPFIPLIYFLCAVILFVQYWLDKFLLLRSWKKAPFVGTKMAKFSRQYFTTAAIVLGAISSAYAYAHSPFTQLCNCSSEENCSLSNTQFQNVQLLNGTEVNYVQTIDYSVKFCNQKQIGFPPVPIKQGVDKWMTASQERLCKIYGWFCLSLLIMYVVAVLGNRLVTSMLSWMRGVYKPTGVDQHKDFSSGIGVESFGYIPQLIVPGFHFPLLACDIDDIDRNLISWRDPSSISYDEHNLIFDVPFSGNRRSRNAAASSSKIFVERDVKPIFNIVKQWLPDWAKEDETANDRTLKQKNR